MISIGVIGSAYDACAHRMMLQRICRKKGGLHQTFHDIYDFLGQVERALNAGVGAKAIHRRMSMHCIAEAGHISFQGLLDDDLVDVQFQLHDDFS